MQMELALGKAPDTLPLDTITVIHVGNALRMDWNEIVPESEATIVMGNPPFIGMAWMSKEQQADNRHVFAPISAAKGLRTGRLDYVACWYAKAAELVTIRPQSRVAFVSTNSITQGEQARTMVPLLASIHR
jgi:hypothetical protein